MKRIIYFLFVVFTILAALPVAKADGIVFVENKGQWDKQVLFKANIPGGDLFITSKGLVYQFIDEETLHQNQHKQLDLPVNAHAIMVNWINTNKNIKAQPAQPVKTVYNYFLGNDASKWVKAAKGFKKVTLVNIYPHIDFCISVLDQSIKTEFVVKPGGNAGLIKCHYAGADDIILLKNQLTLKHSLGIFSENEPISYFKTNLKQQSIPTAFKLQTDTVSYALVQPKLGANDSLIIDPSIVFSTFSGSVADNFGFTATFDSEGNAYAGGTVYAAGFPTTPGAYQLNFKGGSNLNSQSARDVGILKFSADGKTLLYATYLGGSDNEQPHSISCDLQGKLFVMGTTKSSNFPVSGGYDNTYNGGYDLFVVCLNSTGTNLVSGTFLGGTANDGYNGLENSSYNTNSPTAYNYGDSYRGDLRIDSNNTIYIASVTQSKTNQLLPLVNATQTEFGGGQQDGWVIKLNNQLSALLFSSYLGGSGSDAAYSVHIKTNQFYVAGGTTSTNLPLLSNNFKHTGSVDGFVAKFNQIGFVTLDKTVCVGTTAYDQIYFVNGDKYGKVYVTGQTKGTIPKIGSVYHVVDGKQFITVFDAELNNKLLQNAFGGGSSDPKLAPSAFMVDKCDKIYFSGWGGSSNQLFNQNTNDTKGLPVTSDAYQKTTDGSDFYLIIFNSNLKSIGYATYFGGALSAEHVDGGTSHFDSRGAIYQSVCAGCGGYSDFPTTPGAHSNTNNGKRPYNPNVGGCNNAIFKFDAKPNPQAPVMPDTLLTMQLTDTLLFRFEVNDANGDSIEVYEKSGSIFNLSNKPLLITLTNLPGQIRYELRWISDCSNIPDTLTLLLKFRDYSCDSVLYSQGLIRIALNPLPSFNPVLECIKVVSQNQIFVPWKPISSKFLKGIALYQGIDDANYDSIALFPFQTGYNQTVNNIQTNNYCYKIRAFNSCNQASTFSSSACLQQPANTNINAFKFARDTIIYIPANETLSYEHLVTTDENADTLFLLYKGTLANEVNCKISTSLNIKKSTIQIQFKPLCNQVGDTFTLWHYMSVYKCPQPIKDTGRIRVVIIPALPALSVDLPCLRFINTDALALQWQNHTPHNKLSYYGILFKRNNQSPALLDTFVYNGEGFKQFELPNVLQNQYCYSLIAFNTCHIATDTGSWSCSPWADSLYPLPVLPHYVSVVNNKNIEVSWPHQNAWLNEIYRSNFNSPSYTKLASFNLADDTIFIDESADVDVQKKRYCYSIITTNYCGLKPKLNKQACSILLNGVSSPFLNTITWTEYDYFENGTDFYQVLSKDLTQESFESKDKSTDKSYTFHDEKLNKETGIFYYQVNAHENNSFYISQSNQVELKQKPLLHVPNAYTPNADGINDWWNIVPVFVKDYHLKLYDRWGKLVFETTQKHTQVGTADMNNQILPLDAYVYWIMYTGFNEEVLYKTGNVTLLK